MDNQIEVMNASANHDGVKRERRFKRLSCSPIGSVLYGFL